jgi:hypothetical protein
VSCHCRIGKVRFRSGCTLRVFRSQRDLEREQLARELTYHAKNIAADSAPHISGYAVVAWGEDGTTYSAWAAGSDDHHLNYVTVPDYVRGILAK